MDSTELVVGLGVVGVLALIGVAVYYSLQRDKQRAAVLADLAEQLQGTVAASGVDYRYRGLPVHLRHTGSEDDGARTTLTLQLGRGGFMLLVSRRGMAEGRSMLARMVGDEDLEEPTGDERFDASFLVRTRTASSARAVLTDEVRDAILALNERGFGSAVVKCTPDSLAISVAGHLHQYELLADLIDGSAAIFDGFLAECRPRLLEGGE
ncbi:MAG: hypothetical protein QM765_06360 [Myxococcales bacterium]